MAERGKVLRGKENNQKKEGVHKGVHMGARLLNRRGKSGSEIEREKDLDDMRQTAVG